MGPAWLQAFLYKVFFASIFGFLWYLEVVMLLRLLQVVVWKRVMEVNEELISRIVDRIVVLMWISVTVTTHPEDKMFGAISVFKNTTIEMPLTACLEAIDPFHQK